MLRVKIYGAGSIGNHLAHAARRLGWSVAVCDVSAAALARMKKEIYPQRYGQWDEAIALHEAGPNEPRGDFHLILIGTPPDHHVPLALRALEERPRGILIEKPLCTPALEGAEELHRRAANSSTRVFVGYDHVVGKAVRKIEDLYREGLIGDVDTLDVEFREHWSGIFRAHPWLSGPEDTYLGYWRRGGGASGEHSHAINLWQHLAHVVGKGRVADVDAMLQYCRQGQAEYDSVCLLNLRSEGGLVGRVVQDVVTLPPVKRACLQGTRGRLELLLNASPEGDAIHCRIPGRDDQVHAIPKTRPDDFIEELRHIETCLEGPDDASLIRPSPIGVERGLDTMLVVAAAHASEAGGRRVSIDYSKGCTLAAIGRKP
ncbi:MAG: Gfo/Idh/MocA family oxidoreductase [Gemmataceae bacterium]|nr:Gfo/Idh/MocA family oxidoreductase [Gemmataceae bacterium]